MGNFLSKEKQKALADKLDDAVVLGGIAERFNGVVFRLVVGLIDKYTPEDKYDLVESNIDAFMYGDDDGTTKHNDPGGQPHRHE